jgi:hypothetical protein
MLGYAVPIGETSQDGPAEELLTAEDAHDLRVALWAQYASVCRVPKRLQYNLGAGANNVAQQVTYEILAASGRVLTVRGPNPRYIDHGNSIINPEWPSLGPDGEPVARLISFPDPGAIPAGADIVFAAPSILADKLRPWVVAFDLPAIDDPDGQDAVIDLDIEASINVGAAMAPWDLAFPPADGKYYLTLFYYFTAPEPHPNYQIRQETHWAPRSVAYIRTVLDLEYVGWNDVPLLDSGDGETRVLTPGIEAFGWYTGAPMRVVAIRGALTGAERVDTLVPASAYSVAINDTVGGFESRIDLSALEPDATILGVEIHYWAEAVEGDEGAPVWHSSCANSQVDRTGSYIHDAATGRLCANVECSQWESFKGVCWKPGASGFTLFPQAAADPVTSPTDSQWWNRFFSDQDLLIRQGLPGVSSDRNFRIERVGGPSIGMLVGGFANEVPRGAFAADEVLFSPRMGERYIDSETGRQRIRLGLFQSQQEHDGATGSTMASAPLGSVGAAYVSGWSTREGDGGATQKLFPVGNGGGTKLQGYTGTASLMTARCQRSDSPEELFVPGVVLTARDRVLEGSIRDWATGL